MQNGMCIMESEGQEKQLLESLWTTELMPEAPILTHPNSS